MPTIRNSWQRSCVVSPFALTESIELSEMRNRDSIFFGEPKVFVLRESFLFSNYSAFFEISLKHRDTVSRNDLQWNLFFFLLKVMDPKWSYVLVLNTLNA